MAFDGVINSRRNGVMGRGQGGFFQGRGRGGSFHGGRFSRTPRRGPLNLNARSSTYGVSKSYRAKPFPWKRDLLDESLRAAGLPGVENGTKLYISNLDVRVSNEDIRELFSEFGQLRRHAVHYGQSGRPNGSAEVVFARKSDAVDALKRYNDVLLDGKPMKIEIIGSSSEVVPVLPRVNVIGNVSGRRAVTITRGRGGGSFAVNHRRVSFAVNQGFGWRGRGGLRNARGQTRGRSGRGGVWRKKVVDKSADELDKELESYHADAMQT